jgi:cytoskeletal protein CcmA (bactofilin family)
MAAQPTQSPTTTGDEKRVIAWIGQGVVIEGRITSAQDLRIDGRVEGTIEVGSHTVTLGPKANVKANLVAKSILISGTVVGNVTATDRLDLQPTGSVEGDITAPRLVVADGAIIRGKIDTGERRGAKGQSA